MRRLWWLPLAALAICPPAGGSGADYDVFLKRIAADCKPLIIGRDHMSQAILHAGMGVNVKNYHAFLSYTSRLYRGTLSELEYRRSLAAFLGAGGHNGPSSDCIAAHLAATKAR